MTRALEAGEIKGPLFEVHVSIWFRGRGGKKGEKIRLRWDKSEELLTDPHPSQTPHSRSASMRAPLAQGAMIGLCRQVPLLSCTLVYLLEHIRYIA